ncbi:MAG: hypothetical protein V7L01_03735 [Nostoc sp.]|uniref:hypothetical protein n=1 Tax=Nostoc sp. TaxID=1180 RepID=UPI002FF4DB9B
MILSPKAAVYAGINSDVYDGLCLRIIWLTLLISGGLAGVCEVLVLVLVNSALAFL